ncbi:unnamed protein product [Linum trigynum]|uniref:PGG domain-containing protein n=1 Tax=Linum trigynum TaxID=586398 RepID=A0AAV2ELF0_9ROSI
MEINPAATKVDASAIYDAAMRGDTETLQGLLQRDKLVLKKFPLSSFTETPLHISVLAGHLDFSRALLHHNPGMAMEGDASNCTPLHLASAAGHTEIVGALLSAEGGSDACLVRDEDGRIPLHLATMRGRNDVVRELVGARPESLLVKLEDGDTVLHLCVKSGDGEGNTILHAAAMFKQVQTTSYLTSLPSMGAAVNSLNGFGSTALDCLELSPKDFKSLRIRDLLVDAGGKRAKELTTSTYHHHHLPPPNPSLPISPATNKCCKPIKSMCRRFKKFLQYDTEWIKDMKGTLLIVATIIAQMSFQAANNPPGGVWQQNFNSPTEGFRCNATHACTAGTSVHAYTETDFYYYFMGLNTVAFGASLCVILLIVGGFPLKNKFVIWLLAQAMCTALDCMTFAFVIAAYLVSPTKDDIRSWIAVITVILLAVLLLASLVITLLDTLRIVIWSWSKLWKVGARASSCCCLREEQSYNAV